MWSVDNYGIVSGQGDTNASPLLTSIGHTSVMPCGREGNRGSGVALQAMCHRLPSPFICSQETRHALH